MNHQLYPGFRGSYRDIKINTMSSLKSYGSMRVVLALVTGFFIKLVFKLPPSDYFSQWAAYAAIQGGSIAIVIGVIAQLADLMILYEGYRLLGTNSRLDNLPEASNELETNSPVNFVDSEFVTLSNHVRMEGLQASAFLRDMESIRMASRMGSYGLLVWFILVLCLQVYSEYRNTLDFTIFWLIVLVLALTLVRMLWFIRHKSIEYASNKYGYNRLLSMVNQPDNEYGYTTSNTPSVGSGSSMI